MGSFPANQPRPDVNQAIGYPGDILHKGAYLLLMRAKGKVAAKKVMIP